MFMCLLAIIEVSGSAYKFTVPASDRPYLFVYSSATLGSHSAKIRCYEVKTDDGTSIIESIEFISRPFDDEEYSLYLPTTGVECTFMASTVFDITVCESEEL
jgi:hypothetical protein